MPVSLMVKCGDGWDGKQHSVEGRRAHKAERGSRGGDAVTFLKKADNRYLLVRKV